MSVFFFSLKGGGQTVDIKYLFILQCSKQNNQTLLCIHSSKLKVTCLKDVLIPLVIILSNI